MLLYHWKEELGDIIFHQERQQKGSSINKQQKDLEIYENMQVTKNEELKDVSITTMNDA